MTWQIFQLLKLLKQNKFFNNMKKLLSFVAAIVLMR